MFFAGVSFLKYSFISAEVICKYAGFRFDPVKYLRYFLCVFFIKFIHILGLSNPTGIHRFGPVMVSTAVTLLFRAGEKTNIPAINTSITNIWLDCIDNMASFGK
jgi:hypothetical protein